MANLQENFTCAQRQHYMSIYAPGFGSKPSHFFSKNYGLPRTEFDMVYGQNYAPPGSVAPQHLKGSCSCNQQPESRYDGQWFVKENFKHKNKYGVVSGRNIPGV
jgi:hypothetical protein